MHYIYIALGGALGTSLRYLCSNIYKTNFPYATLLINFFGSLVIGLVTFYALKYKISNNLMFFLKVGLCGGFTTFSTFSLESFQLIEKGDLLSAFLYIIFSILICIIAIYIAKNLVNAI